MQWTIGKKLYAGIGLLSVVVLATMIAAMYSQRQLRDSVEELAATTAPNIQRAEHLKFLTEAYRSANQFTVILATEKNAPELEATRSKMEGISAEFARVAGELGQSDGADEVRSLTRDADEAMRAFQAKCLEVYHLAAAFKAPEAAAMIAESKPLGDKVQNLTAKIADLEVARLEVASADAKRADQIGTTMMVTFTVISLLALGVVAYVVWIIVKTLTAMVSRLKSGSEHVTSAATQVAASAQTLSRGSTEQASSLEETSASMEEMASMTRKNAESSQEAARLMAEVDRVVEGSNRSLVDMTRSMVSIRESSDKVSKIIKTIDEIAFQTNILALNAAVEAARAGEAGMGFAVVADEVRNLAQRSAQAAKDTAVLIEESIANSQEGNTKVEQVAASIAAITDSVGKVKGLVGEVSESSRQQSQGIDQVAQAVAQMERVTQSTAASAEEGAAASEELNAQAETAMAEIHRLEIMVVGGWADGSVAHASSHTVSDGPANRVSRLLKLPSKGSASRPPVPSAEDQIPMGDTGTYGRF